jgi:hypothetical protein
MDANQRAYIWEIEHHGQLLGRYGFQRFADVLGRADREALRAFLAPDFWGQEVEGVPEVRAASDYVDVVRRERAAFSQNRGQESFPDLDAWQYQDVRKRLSTPVLQLKRDEFCARLLQYRQLFSSVPHVSLALMNLAPQKRGAVDGLWQGTCQLRIWGEITPGQPGEVVLVLWYQIARPAESTFRQGGWLRACAILQSLTARAPRFLLREAAQERGIDRRRFHDNWTDGVQGTTTGGVYLCDYDRDGYLDMLIVDLKRIALYKGIPGGKFIDVTTEVGLPPRLLNPTGAHLVAAFADLDGDGWVDLILDKKIFRNLAGQRFEDVTHLSNLRLPGDVSGIAVADYDRDARLDLYLTCLTPSRANSWLNGKGDGKDRNYLLRNRGNWQFDEVAVPAGATGGDRSSFTAVWLDANNDGWPDLHVINEFGSGVLLLNQGDGTFREHRLTSGPGDFGSMGVAAGDVDNDGNIDLYVANMYSKAGNRVISNVFPGTYPEEIMATLRSFVAGSQLHRNLGVRGQEAGIRGQESAGRLTQDSCLLTPDSCCLSPDFEPLGQTWQVANVGWAYGPALVDLDNDGWLDIYATAGFMSQDRTKPDG